MKTLISFIIILISSHLLSSQIDYRSIISDTLPSVLEEHRNFVSIPNVSDNHPDMMENIAYAKDAFEKVGLQVELLPSSTLPIFFAHSEIDPTLKTVLFYFHIDGQAVDASRWDQEDPFVPVLKKQNDDGQWEKIDWSKIKQEIDPDWRIFARAAADDKGPIMMMLTALDILKNKGLTPKFNVKIILDPQEEAGSEAFLSTLDKYKSTYAADYMIIMDGPAHISNRPTITYGCRGIATCSLTTYGSKLPQHSGHYGNYSPNPVFRMSTLLSSMKDKEGRVTIDGYYDDINLTEDILSILSDVPDDESYIQDQLYIPSPDNVGNNYQEALQYPSLNVRHIETSWKGPGLKTVIPEYVTAHLDLRLVKETPGSEVIEKIRNHLKKEGYYITETAPTDEERLKHKHIVTMSCNRSVNAFRTDLESEFGRNMYQILKSKLGEDPVRIRTMGGTVPIIPAVNTLGIPALIVPMVNMDNNQHNPNENIRIGNIATGIEICIAILTSEM